MSRRLMTMLYCAMLALCMCRLQTCNIIGDLVICLQALVDSRKDAGSAVDEKLGLACQQLAKQLQGAVTPSSCTAGASQQVLLALVILISSLQHM